MGQQLNKTIKRRRRMAYIARKKEAAKELAIIKPKAKAKTAAPKKAVVKEPAKVVEVVETPDNGAVESTATE